MILPKFEREIEKEEEAEKIKQARKHGLAQLFFPSKTPLPQGLAAVFHK